MAYLKNDEKSKNSAKGKLSSILSELGEIESNEALELIDWFLEKAKYFRKHKKRERFQRLPDKMERGDIIWVNFGINVGDEFSDIGTDGHFAIYWSQNGFQIIVIPISAEERQPEKNSFAVNLGQIPGLPLDKDSYAKIDMIRAISIRRIRRIKNQEFGKISLKSINPNLIQAISDKIQEKLL
ncbi:hypothetical protein A7W90_12270 [Clostridium sp. Bc-iso-3]|nr:hypothetical protein A7W90_12270 [Clostridium sp. Bc-iso-3]